MLGAAAGAFSEEISAAIVIDEQKAYFVLSDGSSWQVFPFVKRWRTPSEWWNGVELEAAKNYNCVPSDWYVGTEIAVYPREGHDLPGEENASNLEKLRQATHFLFNARTGQILFAVRLHPADCMRQIYDDGKATGYSTGHAIGYNSGYDVGYQLGEVAGRRKTWQQCEGCR
jgi:hypothetical protein